jgi:pyrimidine deaminase RibD-like protein
MPLHSERILEICKATLAEAKLSTAEDERHHPFVGAILTTQDGEILASAHRGETEGGHAEFCLIEKAKAKGIDLSECILFVTLEPCIKRGVGKVPCAVRIQQSGIRTVYIGTLDPDPKITGKGEMFLIYAGVRVEHFPAGVAQEIREVGKAFFNRFRAAHFWEPTLPASFSEASANVESPFAASTREGLLYQTLELMNGTAGPVWISAGNLSWVRELQVAFLAATLNGREIRLLHQIESAQSPLNEAVRALGVLSVRAPTRTKLRFTLVSPGTELSTAMCVDNASATFLRASEEEGLTDLLKDWFETHWSNVSAPERLPVRIEEIDRNAIFAALRNYVPQYKNLRIGIETVKLKELRPATHVVELFKLFRISQFSSLRQRHNIPDLAIVRGTPWPLINLPIVERLPNGQMVVIDGTHRCFSAFTHGNLSTQAIVVDNDNFDLPSQPHVGWDLKVSPTKLPREHRYQNFEPTLFRPIRKALESLATRYRD